MHHTSSPSGHLFCCMLPQHAGERRLLKSRRLRPRENAHGRTQAQAPPSADDCRMSPIPRPAGSLCRIAYAEGSLKPFWGKRRPALQNSGTPAAKNGLWRPQAAPRRNAGQGAETEKAPGRQGRGLSRIWGCGVSHAAGSVRRRHHRCPSCTPNVPPSKMMQSSLSGLYPISARCPTSRSRFSSRSSWCRAPCPEAPRSHA